MESFFRTTSSLFLIWLFCCIALRIYIFLPSTGHPPAIEWGTTLDDLVKNSAKFDGGVFKEEVRVTSVPFSIFTLFFLEIIEIQDMSGMRMTVIGEFPTPHVGDTILITGYFKQVMNNSLVHDFCVLIYVSAE